MGTPDGSDLVVEVSPLEGEDAIAMGCARQGRAACEHAQRAATILVVTIAPNLRRRVEAALSRHPEICAAWVFGSVARGEEGSESDLDLAVLLARDTDAEAARPALSALSLELEPCSPSGRVDVLVLGTQGPVLVHRILSEGFLVRDVDRERRVQFEGRATVDYLDWKPTHDIAMRSALDGLRDRFARMGRP